MTRAESVTGQEQAPLNPADREQRTAAHVANGVGKPLDRGCLTCLNAEVDRLAAALTAARKREQRAVQDALTAAADEVEWVRRYGLRAPCAEHIETWLRNRAALAGEGAADQPQGECAIHGDARHLWCVHCRANQ